MGFVYSDFETQSAAKFDGGAYLYVNHPTTRPMAFGFHAVGTKEDGVGMLPWEFFNGGVANRVDLWADTYEWLCDLVKDESNVFVFHNAFFDYWVWTLKALAFPRLPISRVKCTMAKAYAHGLPPSLEGMAEALNLKVTKDAAGKETMLFLSKPKADGTFWTPGEQPEKFNAMYDYCHQDNEVMMQADQLKDFRDLTPQEQKIWELDFKINNFGLRIDIPLVEKTITFIEKQKEIDTKEFFDTVGGKVEGLVRPTQRDKFKTWLKLHGFPIPNTKKITLYKFMLRTDLPDFIRQAVLIYQSANKSSLAKYPMMLKQSDEHGIIRELTQYHGAHTGRVGHRGVQWGNTARPDCDVRTVCSALESFGFETFSWMYE